MIALLALLLALQPEPAAAASADRELLSAFRAACEHVDDVPTMRADAVASGWEEMPEAADPRIARLLTLGREAMRDEGGQASGATFRRTIAGRNVFLVQSRWEDEEGVWGNGCRLFHFEAAGEIAPATLEAWMGTPATGVQEVPGVAVKRLWEPGWRSGVTLEINHVPAGSEIVERFGLSGNILVAQAIGGF